MISQDQDPFFAKNMFLNFGDLGQNAKDYVEQFASKQASGQKLDSIEDMKRFVEDYPEFRRLSGNVTKHVTLVTELSRRVGADNLLDVSELEQSLACSDNHSQDVKSLQKLIQDPSIPPNSKLRLVAIYALRYSAHANNSTPPCWTCLQSPVESAEFGSTLSRSSWHMHIRCNRSRRQARYPTSSSQAISSPRRDHA